MELGLRSPLIDSFRRGEVDREVRLLAAAGGLAPRVIEQLTLLALLTSDQDAEVAAAADETLRGIPTEALAGALARSDSSGELRAFFAERGISPAAAPAGDDQPLVGAAPVTEDPEVTEPAGPELVERQTTLQKIAGLSVAERTALAMRGSREERSILIRDPNKLVACAVLSSPKLTESEVEAIAKMASISDELLRIIANTRAWAKSYAIVAALVRNPKTPVALSMNMLSRLVEKDLRLLSTDRNVPEILRITARQKLVLHR